MDVTLRRMHGGLLQRRRPEEVAVDLVDLGVHRWLEPAAAAQLEALARHGQIVGAYRGHAMPSTYRTHPGLGRAYAAADRVMRAVTDTAGRPAMPAADPSDPASLRAFVAAANTVLGLSGEANPVHRGRVARFRTHTWSYDTVDGEVVTDSWSARNGSRGRRGDSHGHADPRTRYTADQRRAALPGVSVRTYRRAVATVGHLEQRTEVLAAERDREASVAFAKARLAHTIEVDEFCGHVPTAAFVAYYVARLGLRTVFTNGSQDRPMDAVADALLRHAAGSVGFRADVVSRVLTRRAVLALLDDDDRGRLFGAYTEQLAASGRALERAFDANRDRTRMVARPGDDSSTWNVATRAFNQARTGWLNLAGALGLDDLVEQRCPGKVPALVAADVAAWHRDGDGGQHADVAVWAVLPLPWEVLDGRADCSAELVRGVCAAHGVDAEASGWTAGYRQDGLSVTGPTPELVHGVAVSSPVLAAWMRHAGWFSGRATPVS